MKNGIKNSICVFMAVLFIMSCFTVALPKTQAASRYKAGDTVSFGSYPQSELDDWSYYDEQVLEKLNAAKKTWHSLGWYSGDGDMDSIEASDYAQYCDVTVDGTKYRGIKTEKSRPSYTYKTGYSSDSSEEISWYKYEPLQWRIIDPTTGLAVCENVIDAQSFAGVIYPVEEESSEGEDTYGDYTWVWNDYYECWMQVSSGTSTTTLCYANEAHTHYSNEYTYSAVRYWLNNTFLAKAFSSDERKLIKATTLKDCVTNGTTDKVFLLSQESAESAGLITASSEAESSYSSEDDTYVSGTDYYCAVSDYGDRDWLLRTSGEGSCGVYAVDGWSGEMYDSYSYRVLAVRPAVYLTLDAESSGDIDGDGKITAADARLALRISVGYAKTCGNIEKYADVNGDGKVEAADARIILRYSVGLEKSSALLGFLPSETSSSGTEKELVKDVTVYVGDKDTVGDDIIPEKGQKVTFTSTNKSAVTVTSKGVVTAVGKGFACIIAKAGNSKFYYYYTVRTALQKKIYALQSKYPDGYYWNNNKASSKYPAVSEYPCTDHSSKKYSKCKGQCAGFANLMSNEVFGSKAKKTYGVTAATAKIGDVVRIKPSHSIFITDIQKKGDIIGYDMYDDENIVATETKYYVVHCNWDCQCGILWTGKPFKLVSDSVSIVSGDYYTKHVIPSQSYTRY